MVTALHYPLDGDPVAIPLDPADLNRIPPSDIDVCDVCMGDGCIDTFVAGEGQSDECWACHGTGIRPDAMPVLTDEDCDVCQGTGLIKSPYGGPVRLDIHCWSCKGSGESGAA